MRDDEEVLTALWHSVEIMKALWLVDLVLDSMDSHLMQQSTVVDIAEDENDGRITPCNVHQAWSIWHEMKQQNKKIEGSSLRQHQRHTTAPGEIQGASKEQCMR
jgi:hypothetical protein